LVVQLATVLFLLFVPSVLRADTLDDLARDFWAWRAAEQPVSSDDIPRIERPSGWVPDWSPEAVARYHKQLDEYETRWQKIDASAGPIPRQVDYRLMGSALSRVRWELDRIRKWQSDPSFYVQQTVESSRQLLTRSLPTMRMGNAIGRDNYVFFLKNVALLPFSPEQLLEMGKQEWARSVASQVYEEHRNAGIPELRLFKDESEQIAHEQKDELA